MDTLYDILSITQAGNTYTAQVVFNPEHIIYKAHFPNRPITPGVILLQISHHCAEQILRQKIEIKTIKMIKFTNYIIPQTNKIISFHIQITDNTIKTTIADEQTQYAKLQFSI